ncbi:hypothetical protein BX600DRAFT_454049 [Xylariales sp. PMI_506]|nr:hypothetical protein BX600DRAFT_454049 [Xylariales sp. PMI_506]
MKRCCDNIHNFSISLPFSTSLFSSHFLLLAPECKLPLRFTVPVLLKGKVSSISSWIWLLVVGFVLSIPAIDQNCGENHSPVQSIVTVLSYFRTSAMEEQLGVEGFSVRLYK